MKENEKSKNSLTSSNVQSPKDWSGRILELVLYALAFSAFNGGIYSLLLLQYTTGKWSNVAIIIGITGISLGLISILGGIEIRKSRKLLEAPIFHSQYFIVNKKQERRLTMEQRESTEKSDEKRFLLNDPTAEDLKPTPEVQSFYRAQILSTQAAEASAGYTVIAIM